jgi:hypothetical protein
MSATSSTGRQAEKRARYLERTTCLDRRPCRAVAYAELGYADAGVAGEIDATAGTVGKYLRRAIARFGPEAVYPAPVDERGDLEPVTVEDVLDWPDHYVELFREAADEHPDVVAVPSDATTRRRDSR